MWASSSGREENEEAVEGVEVSKHGIPLRRSWNIHRGLKNTNFSDSKVLEGHHSLHPLVWTYSDVDQ
jgi:hypothetical protein